MKRFAFAVAAMLLLARPAVAQVDAPYITVEPKHLVLTVGQSGTITAQLFKRRTHFGQTTNSCWYSGSSKDVLKLESSFSKQNGDVFGYKVLAQKPGTCKIQFYGDGASAIADVTVKS